MAVARVVRPAVALWAVLGAGLAVPAVSSARSGDPKPSPAVLRDRDPGARVDGNTIVLRGNGAVVTGVPGRPNFIVALGSHEKVVGGSENSELGALGQGDALVATGSHELVVGGPHGKVVASGPGHDLLLDSHSDATIDVKSPGDEVIVTGRDDHVVCSGNSFHDQIYVNRSDTVSKSCRRHHDLVRPDSQVVFASDFSPPTAHAAGTVTGSGTDFDPYRGTCESGYPGCTVFFPPRTLSGFWSNERVPAYQCPANNPYLTSEDFAPWGTSIPDGVEIKGLGPIGVYIPNALISYLRAPEGTLGSSSSATNWTVGTASYQVVLHCTSTAP